MNEFDEIMKTMGNSDEILGVIEMASGHKEYEDAIVAFIKDNKIDCSHLWEDGEEGDRSTEDWHKLIEFVLKLIPDEEE